MTDQIGSFLTKKTVGACFDEKVLDRITRFCELHFRRILVRLPRPTLTKNKSKVVNKLYFVSVNRLDLSGRLIILGYFIRPGKIGIMELISIE